MKERDEFKASASYTGMFSSNFFFLSLPEHIYPKYNRHWCGLFADRYYTYPKPTG